MSLEICNITKSFDRLKVLENVNLTLEEQNIYCLMGASGSGKTTLFRIILGLEHPDPHQTRDNSRHYPRNHHNAADEPGCLHVGI